MTPLTPTASRFLYDFYNNLNSPSSGTATTPRCSEESIENNNILIVTIPASRAVEEKLVPEGTVFYSKDMVLRSYVSRDRDLEEVVEEWRKIGDVVVQKVGGRFGYTG